MQRCLPHTAMSNTVEQCCHATELQQKFPNCRSDSLARIQSLGTAQPNTIERTAACVHTLALALHTRRRNLMLQMVTLCALPREPSAHKQRATGGEQVMISQCALCCVELVASSTMFCVDKMLSAKCKHAHTHRHAHVRSVSIVVYPSLRRNSKNRSLQLTWLLGVCMMWCIRQNTHSDSLRPLLRFAVGDWTEYGKWHVITVFFCLRAVWRKIQINGFELTALRCQYEHANSCQDARSRYGWTDWT